MYEGLLKQYQAYLPVTEKNTNDFFSRRKYATDSFT